MSVQFFGVSGLRRKHQSPLTRVSIVTLALLVGFRHRPTYARPQKHGHDLET